MVKRAFTLFVAMVALLLPVHGLHAAASVTYGGDGVTAKTFIEKGVSASDGDWIRLNGVYYCRIRSDSWSATTVDVETFEEGTLTIPTDTSNIAVSDLVGVTADTAWVRLEAGDGYYRIEVDGVSSIDWLCRKVE